MDKSKLMKLFRIIFILLGIASLIYILFIRFAESITRSYGVDEYYHLHYAWLISQGKLPYSDFQTIYSPFFHLTLLPLFRIFGDSFAVFIASRIVIFAFFLLGLLFTFGIGMMISSLGSAFLAVIIAAGLPMGIEKAIEIRPDNLMTMLFLGGVFCILKGLKQGRKIWYIGSGILFGLGFITMVKISFSLLGLALGLLLFLAKRRMKKKQFKGLVHTLFSFFSILIISGFVLSVKGLMLPFMDQVIFNSSAVISSLRFGIELHPFFWFLPNDAVYGIYKGFAWYLNCFLFFMIIFSLVGIIRERKKESFIYKILIFIPLITSFAYLYLVLRPFQQYLLLFLALVPFFIALGVMDCYHLIFKSREWLKYILGIVLFAAFILAVHESWQVKKHWFDGNDRKFINYVLTKTKKEDVFWGGDGNYVFRHDGYYAFTLRYMEVPSKVKAKYPPLIPMLEERRTKYLLLPTEAINKRIWPFDSKDKDEFVNWVKKNFMESDYPGIWVRKK